MNPIQKMVRRGMFNQGYSGQLVANVKAEHAEAFEAGKAAARSGAPRDSSFDSYWESVEGVDHEPEIPESPVVTDTENELEAVPDDADIDEDLGSVDSIAEEAGIAPDDDEDDDDDDDDSE